MPALAAGGVISAGGQIAGGIIKNKGAKKAAKAQKKAIKSLTGVDITNTKTQAADTDVENYARGFETQDKYDPLYGSLRRAGATSMLNTLADDTSGNSSADRVLAEMEKAINDGDTAKRDALVTALLDKAKEEVDQGAQLSPEFQAELVRSGLASAGRSGESLAGSATAGSRIRTLVGSAGEQLKQTRLASAQHLLAAADAAKTTRANLLTNVLQAGEALRTNRSNRAGVAAGLGMASVPKTGISGADVANLLVANNDLENQKRLALGGVKANSILTQAAGKAQMISSATNMMGSFLGGLSGGGGILGGLANMGGNSGQ